MHCIGHFKVLNRFVYIAVELYFWLGKNTYQVKIVTCT